MKFYDVATLNTMLIAVVPAGGDIGSATKYEEGVAGAPFDDEPSIYKSVKYVDDMDAFNAHDWIFWGRNCPAPEGEEFHQDGGYVKGQAVRK